VDEWVRPLIDDPGDSDADSEDARSACSGFDQDNAQGVDDGLDDPFGVGVASVDGTVGAAHFPQSKIERLHTETRLTDFDTDHEAPVGRHFEKDPRPTSLGILSARL
jgi:hypothetical protein